MKIKPIKITTEDGKTYTLEFDRDSVLNAEENGFAIEEADRFPLSSTYKLIYFAFYKHHPEKSYEWVKNFIDEIFGGINGLPKGFMDRLGEMYASGYGSLSDGTSKNVKARVEL